MINIGSSIEQIHRMNEEISRTDHFSINLLASTIKHAVYDGKFKSMKSIKYKMVMLKSEMNTTNRKTAALMIAAK